MKSAVKYMLVLFWIANSSSDEIDIQLTSGNIQKILRAMTNETKGGDSLNLPANASSIRENITDTFSCENRTYGYYADVDNDCQVFHVCLPSQTPSGRNVTYRWSFICPNETIFNQEVLVCTRPRDAIPCEDSPMFYDVNMEIGKVSNDTKDQDNPNKQVTNVEPSKDNKAKRNQNRRPVNRKQNIVVGDLLKEVVDEEIKKIEEIEADAGIEMIGNEEIVPVLVENEKEPNMQDVEDEFDNAEVKGRLIEERSMPYSRNLRRGTFRFKADV